MKNNSVPSQLAEPATCSARGGSYKAIGAGQLIRKIASSLSMTRDHRIMTGQVAEKIGLPCDENVLAYILWKSIEAISIPGNNTIYIDCNVHGNNILVQVTNICCTSFSSASHHLQQILPVIKKSRASIKINSHKQTGVCITIGFRQPVDIIV